MLINTIFNKINQIKSTGLFFVSPHPYSVGNNSEQLHFALMKAADEEKKVYILFPFDIHFLFRRRLTNHALFNIRSDLIYLQNPLLKFVSRLLVSLLIFPARFYDLLIGIFGYSLSEFQVIPSVGTISIWLKKDHASEFSWERLNEYQWSQRTDQNFEFQFPLKDDKKANKSMLKLGISKVSWFVCLHVRESGFRNDAGKREYRNANIEKYIPAIKEITRLGGIVVRLGDKTMKPLPPMDNVIDYPFTDSKSDLMDIYLIKHCRFYISAPSGIYDTAALFGKKILMINTHMWVYGYPLQVHDRGILQHVYSLKKKRFLTLKERISSDWNMQNLWGDIEKDYILFENSSDDIKNAVIEYIHNLDQNNFLMSKAQNIINSRRIDKGKNILDLKHLAPLGVLSDELQIFAKYRLASKFYSSKGSISNSFVEKYWNEQYLPSDDDIKKLKTIRSS